MCEHWVSPKHTEKRVAIARDVLRKLDTGPKNISRGTLEVMGNLRLRAKLGLPKRYLARTVRDAMVRNADEDESRRVSNQLPLELARLVQPPNRHKEQAPPSAFEIKRRRVARFVFENCGDEAKFSGVLL